MSKLVVDRPDIKITTSDFFSSKPFIEELLYEKVTKFVDSNKEFFSLLHDSLPIIDWKFTDGDKNAVDLKIIAKYRPNIGQFFYQLLAKGTLGKELPIELFFSCNFTIEGSLDKWVYTQISLNLNEDNYLKLTQRKKAINAELSLGATSEYHAKHMGEFKGLSSDAKTQVIHEKITSLISSRKKRTDPKIFSRMQHFLVTCQEEFKKKRDSTHLTRIISIVHLLRQLLEKKISQNPKKRHSIVKFIKTTILDEGKKKDILGVIVGLNFLKEHEIFEERHLYKAISSLVNDVQTVKNSCFMDSCKQKKFQIVYLEIEKKEHAFFSLEEVRLLKDQLSLKVQGSIESLMHAVFMPRNEEEVFRNIVTLAKQVKYVHDIPQIIINFQHKQEPLVFNVVMVRLLTENAQNIEELIKKSSMNMSIERKRSVGVIRKKYVKEASVIKVVIPSYKFIRFDHSIDLYRAREEIINQLNLCFGDIRDYNGGMIDRQNRLLHAFKTLCNQMKDQHEILMEKFFFAIRPQEMRVMLDPQHLKNLFILLLNLLSQEHSSKLASNDFMIKQEDKAVYAVVKKEQKKVLNYFKSQEASFRLICFSLIELDKPFSGFILRGEDKKVQEQFISLLKGYFKDR